jgi:DNA-binding MltR family transcriptional regulator
MSELCTMRKRRPVPPLDELTFDAKRFLEDMQAETDRGVALVAVAFLEDCLGALLRSLCIEDPGAVRGLLNTYWSIDKRAQLAYCLGRIPRRWRSDLEIINGIRNEFGHGHRPASFADPKIAPLCERLQDLTSQETVAVGDPPPRPTCRDRFVHTVAMLSLLILADSQAHERERRSGAPSGAGTCPSGDVSS